METIFFLAIKFLLYCSFIYVGLRVFRGDKAGYIVLSLVLAALRVVLGLVIGLVAIVITSIKTAPNTNVDVLIPVIFSSAILWTIFGRLLSKCWDQRTFYWIGAAISLSGALDLYALLASPNIMSWHFC
jgi:hypothetical protein